MMRRKALKKGEAPSSWTVCNHFRSDSLIDILFSKPLLDSWNLTMWLSWASYRHCISSLIPPDQIQGINNLRWNDETKYSGMGNHFRKYSQCRLNYWFMSSFFWF
jgi:hypothetical protein